MKYLILIVICIPYYLYSQTIINQGTAKATLHVNQDLTASKAEGIIVPQLSLSELNQKSNSYTQAHSGAIIYINDVDTTPITKNQKIRKKGYYYFDGNQWRVFVEDQKKIFPLPYFIEQHTSNTTNQELDIYQLYIKQFTKDPVNQFLSNNGILEGINQIYERDQLDYVITYYDTETIQVNGLTTDGVLNYDVISTNFNLNSYINITLVVK